MDVWVWMIPNHMRPSHSIKGLKRGAFERSHSFRDRIYLTDVGDALWRAAEVSGAPASFTLRSHRQYMITKAEISAGDITIDIEGHRLGMSSWTHAFRVNVKGGDRTGALFLDKVLGNLGRVPIDSPYWGANEWETIRNTYRITRDAMMAPWRQALPNRSWSRV